MGQSVENNLHMRKKILKKAELHPFHLIIAWVWGVVGCWLLLIPTINAIKVTVNYLNTELAVTDMRVIGKAGFINRVSLDVPLNKIQAVNVKSGLWGKILKYGDIAIQSGGSNLVFCGVKDADAFKQFIMNRVDEYENDKIRAQAKEMAAAMQAQSQM